MHDNFITRAIGSLSLINLTVIYSIITVIACWTNGRIGIGGSALIAIAAIIISINTADPTTESKGGSWLVVSLTVTFALMHSYLGSEIRFTSVDPAAHYDMCRTFSENKTTLNLIKSQIMDYSDYPIGYYVYCGVTTSLAGEGDDFQSRYAIFTFANYALLALLLQSITELYRTFSNRAILVNTFTTLTAIGPIYEIFIEGFLSQAFGLWMLFSYVRISLIGLEKSSSWILSLRVLIASGIFLSYQYYFALAFIIDFWGLFRLRCGRKSFYKTVLVYSLSMIAVSPMICMYLGASAKNIGADGSSFRDLIYSYIPFFPGLLLFARKSVVRIETQAKQLAEASGGMSLAMLTMVYSKAASPYYFFKLFPVNYIFLCVLCLVWLRNRNEAIKYIKHRLVILSTMFFGFGFSEITSTTLSASNRLIYKETILKLIAPPTLDREDIRALSALKTANPDRKSTCIESSDPTFLIWGTEITQGIFYRGDYELPYIWSRPEGWKSIEIDSHCEGAYHLYLKRTCGSASEVTYKNHKWCLYSNSRDDSKDLRDRPLDMSDVK